MPSRPPRRNALQNMQLVLAARSYYLDGATKSAIAKNLGLSRFKVARLLDEAVSEGVVTFQIHAPSDVDIDLSVELAAAFGLRQALVLRLPDVPEDVRRDQLGQACASVLSDVIEEGDVVGVAWGRTLHAMVQGLPPLPKCTVVQIVGSVPSSDLRINSLDLARTMAERAAGEICALHVPMIVDSEETVARLLRDPYVQETAAMFDRLDRAIVGVGAWTTGQSSLMESLFDDAREQLAAAGAVADLCTTVLDAEGREVLAGELSGRSVAISAQQLRRVPDVIAIVGGPARASAIRAALRSGLIHRLFTDDLTASALLRQG